MSVNDDLALLYRSLQEGRFDALASIPYHATFAALGRVEAELDTYRQALERIVDNAESWHGPEGLDTGHARALAVIATWGRALLGSTGLPPTAEPDGSAGAEAEDTA